MSQHVESVVLYCEDLAAWVAQDRKALGVPGRVRSAAAAGMRAAGRPSSGGGLLA